MFCFLPINVPLKLYMDVPACLPANPFFPALPPSLRFSLALPPAVSAAVSGNSASGFLWLVREAQTWTTLSAQQSVCCYLSVCLSLSLSLSLALSLSLSGCVSVSQSVSQSVSPPVFVCARECIRVHACMHVSQRQRCVCVCKPRSR